ncbi:hypothetical protein D0T87_14595 [Bacteroides sp. 51]|nr:hypothetical protein [Bacteroides sp. 51]
MFAANANTGPRSISEAGILYPFRNIAKQGEDITYLRASVVFTIRYSVVAEALNLEFQVLMVANRSFMFIANM